MQFDPLDLIFEPRHLLWLSRERAGRAYCISLPYSAVESSQLTKRSTIFNFVVNSFRLFQPKRKKVQPLQQTQFLVTGIVNALSLHLGQREREY